MPEGPEIRLAADKIEAVLKGKPAERIEFGLASLRRFTKPLTGSTVLSLETRGKALLTHFNSGYTIYSHNQLYGVWRVVKRDKLPKTNRQLRLAIHTEEHSALLYSASDISVWKTEKIEEHPFLQRIGPDILNPNLTWREVAERLQSKAFSGRALNSVYLDQAFLAGLGNYLRSEILFVAGIHPAKKARELSKGEIGKLARATLHISQRSYALRGVTIPDRQYKALKKKGISYGKARFFVFSRANQPCRVCKTKIQRSSANSRRIYTCAGCQPND
ncbi:MAG: Endonuclease 8 [Halieaceae bacterium]|jgi:endonuclease-8|nr:MAG: Endonuclease 8 [Halieaceae bacterium]